MSLLASVPVWLRPGAPRRAILRIMITESASSVPLSMRMDSMYEATAKQCVFLVVRVLVPLVNLLSVHHYILKVCLVCYHRPCSGPC